MFPLPGLEFTMPFMIDGFSAKYKHGIKNLTNRFGVRISSLDMYLMKEAEESNVTKFNARDVS